MANLSIYLDGKFFRTATASAKQIAMHTDDTEYPAKEAAKRFGFSGILPIDVFEEFSSGKVVGMVKIVDENRY